MALKLAALRHTWAHFCQREESDAQRQALAEFVREGGDSLRYQAAYDGI
nr:4-alpha-glucanotransferase [Candidatus Pantoea persica]